MDKDRVVGSAKEIKGEAKMHHMSESMKACIEDSLHCYQACLGAAMHHCLEVGGEHIEPSHFRLMMACAEICRTAAHFMLLGSEHYKHVCRECAEICDQCAAACDRLGDMQECVEASRRSAKSCRIVAG